MLVLEAISDLEEGRSNCGCTEWHLRAVESRVHQGGRAVAVFGSHGQVCYRLPFKRHIYETTSSSAKKPAAKTSKDDAFTEDFRLRVRSGQGGGSRKVSKQPDTDDSADDIIFLGEHKVRHPPSLSQTPPAAQRGHDQWKQDTFSFLPDEYHHNTPAVTSSRRKGVHTPLSDEEIGGFADADVTQPPPTLRKGSELVFRGAAKNTVSRYLVCRCASLISRYTKLVGILANTEIEGDTVVALSKKKMRSPKKRLTGAASRAFEALPSWIHDTIISVIIPSLIKFYGAQDNPWSIDGDNTNKFRNVLRALVRQLHPGHEDEVSRGDHVWKFVRSCGTSLFSYLLTCSSGSSRPQ